MIWWAFCCGDESSVQSSRTNSPTTAVAAHAPSESTPLLAPHPSASVTPPTEREGKEGDVIPSPLSERREEQENAGKRCSGDDNSVSEPRRTDEGADVLAWKVARANLLHDCSPDSIEKTNETSIEDCDLSLPVPLDSLPKPTSMKHVAQLSTWDCGLACLEMVFDWLGVRAGVDRQAILKSIPTRSVWSADLVRLLDQRLFADTPLNDDGDDDPTDAHTSLPNSGNPKGRYLFCSQTLSVNDELDSFAYYQSTFESDRIRVDAAFQWLKDQRGKSLIQRPCLPLRDVVELLLRPDCVALVLVDNAILTGLRRADELEHVDDGMTPRDETPNNASSGAGSDDVSQPGVAKSNSAIVYMGHYILLTGIVAAPKAYVCESDSDDADEGDENDDEPFMFQAHNPSLDFGPVLLPPKLLDDARRAPGTDHDVIFIVKLTSDQDG